MKHPFLSVIMLNVRAMRARALIRFIGMRREPTYLILSCILPLLGVASYLYLYEALHTPIAYIGYIVLGGTLVNFWITMLWSMSEHPIRIPSSIA